MNTNRCFSRLRQFVFKAMDLVLGGKYRIPGDMKLGLNRLLRATPSAPTLVAANVVRPK